MRIIVFVLSLFIALAPADARWRRAESTNFIVYSEFSESRMHEYVTELERFDRLLRHFSGLETQESLTKLRIFVVRDQERISDYLTGEAQVGGKYFSDLRGPYAIVPRRTAGYGRFRVTGQNVLFHEYSHHFMMQYFPTSYPAWYIEGFADFYSTVRFRSEDRIELGFPVRSNVPWLRLFSWIPHEALLSNTLRNNRMTYAQGWLLVHHATFHPEMRLALNNYLQAISQNIDPQTAYQDNFGNWDPDLDDILTEYGTSRRMPVLRFELALPPAGPIEIQELTDDEAAVALLYARQGDELHDRVEELLEDYPDNPQVHVEAAISAIERNDIETAIMAADAALALDETHVEANIYRGIATLMSIGYDPETQQESESEPATENQTENTLLTTLENVRTALEVASDPSLTSDPRWQEARRYFVRANRLDNNNALALTYYFRSFPVRAERPNNAMAALDQAFQFVPQSSEIRLLMGREYIETRRFDEARSIVAGNPHRSSGTTMGFLIQERATREVGFDQAAAVMQELIQQEEAALAENSDAEARVAAATEQQDEGDEGADDGDESDDQIYDDRSIDEELDPVSEPS